MYSNLLLQMDNIQLDGPAGYMNMDSNGILISGPTAGPSGFTKMGSTCITISSGSNIAELDLVTGLTTTQIQSPSSNLQIIGSVDFTGGVNFTGTITAYPTAGTNVPTTQWVKDAINYAENGRITALAITGTLTFAKTYSIEPLVLLTVDMGSGTTIVSCALAGVSITGFNYILSSITGVRYINYYVIVV
jgi:hypothetical protein